MRFSLLLTLYNPKIDQFKRAIDSAEDMFDEIIVVNDDSKNTPEIEHFMNYERPDIYYIKHDGNEGAAEARNTGIRFAGGDVICLLDWDDYFEKRGVLNLKKRVEQSEADVWHFILQQFGDDNSLYGKDASPKDLEYHNSIPGMSWFRKSLWAGIGGYNTMDGEDWDFWYRAYNSNYVFEYFPEIVYHYNRHSDSMSAKWVGEKFEEIKRNVTKKLK